MTAPILDYDKTAPVPDFLLMYEADLYAGETCASYWQARNRESLRAARVGYLVERAANPGQLWDRLAEVAR